MSNFMDTAVAVEPIIRMLYEGGCKYPSTVIFEDGSGSIVVDVADQDKTRDLLCAHGVDLGNGYCDSDNHREYNFDLDLSALKNYSETHCPHCGEDITAAS